MPRKLLRENSLKAGSVIEIVEPFVMTRPMPRSAVSVASVMMKGGRPIFTMPNPWKRPIARPITRVRITDSHTGKPACSR